MAPVSPMLPCRVGGCRGCWKRVVAQGMGTECTPKAGGVVRRRSAGSSRSGSGCWWSAVQQHEEGSDRGSSCHADGRTLTRTATKKPGMELKTLHVF